jgi:hypothetical protein
LAVAQNGPAPPASSSALTIIRLFRVVIESSNARAARFASAGFQRASWVLGSVEADVLNHRIARTTAPALSARRCPSRRSQHQYPRQSKAAGSGGRHFRFLTAQQNRFRSDLVLTYSKAAGFATSRRVSSSPQTYLALEETGSSGLSNRSGKRRKGSGRTREVYSRSLSGGV